MYFIDDIYLIFSLIWFESCFFDKISHIFYEIVRGSIDLDTIEHIAIVKSDTMSTLVTGISILQIETIDSLREDTSSCRLTSSTRTREYIGVSNAILYE